jgi:hypothetical protein
MMPLQTLDEKGSFNAFGPLFHGGLVIWGKSESIYVGLAHTSLHHLRLVLLLLFNFF